VLFIIIRTHIFHNKNAKEEVTRNARYKSTTIDGDSIYEVCSENVTSLLMATSKSLNKALDSLVKEKRKKLKDDMKTVKELNKEAKSLKKEVPKTLQRIAEESFESAHSYIEVVEYLREVMHCLSHIVNPSYEHVDNNHAPLTSYQRESLNEVTTLIQSYINDLVGTITSSDFSTSEKMIEKSQRINELIMKNRKKQLKTIKKEPGSTRTNMLYMDILSEIKNLVLHVNNIYKAFRDLADQNHLFSMKLVEEKK
jgi:Na+/phosphate symporter